MKVGDDYQERLIDSGKPEEAGVVIDHLFQPRRKPVARGE
jgi:hypothetical protein